jgi:hypothetical protein
VSNWHFPTAANGREENRFIPMHLAEGQWARQIFGCGIPPRTGLRASKCREYMLLLGAEAEIQKSLNSAL